MRHAAEHDRRRIAESSFERALHPVRTAQRPALGGVTEGEPGLLGEVDDRRADHGLAAQRAHLGAAVARDGGGHEGGAEVDAEVVAHPPSFWHFARIFQYWYPYEVG